jgi:hypothetical protein
MLKQRLMDPTLATLGLVNQKTRSNIGILVLSQDQLTGGNLYTLSIHTFSSFPSPFFPPESNKGHMSDL